MVVLLLLLLSSFLRFLSSRQEREFRFRSGFKIKRIKRRNFFSTMNVRHEDASTSREREVEICFRGFLFDVAREHRPRNVQRAVSGRAADSACIVLGTRKLFLLARGLSRITQHARTTLIPFVDVTRQGAGRHTS